jgi:hypothetical protein
VFGQLGYAEINYPLNSIETADLTTFDASPTATPVGGTALTGYGAIDPNQFTLFQLVGH